MVFNKKQDHVAQLGEWSDNVLDVFNNTVNNLHAINDKIDDHHADLHNQKAKIEQDMQNLQNMKARHARVIEKVQAILD
jgi:hypothetical protein